MDMSQDLFGDSDSEEEFYRFELSDDEVDKRDEGELIQAEHLEWSRAAVPNPRAMGRLLLGRTERINNLHYFLFIYYLSLNNVLF